MAIHKIKQDGKVRYVDDSAGDAHTNPEYACYVEYIEVGGQRIGVVHNWPAFLKNYGPENQEQIDWHVAHGTPGAEKWEVGVPV